MKKDYPDIQALENEKWQDHDPVTGKLGTRVPAKWLQLVEDSSKSLTLEILEVLKEAKIEPNELKNTQLKDAVVAIAAARTINWKDVQNAPKILDVLGDSKIDGASQRIVNEVNRLARDATTAANLANDKANQKRDVDDRLFEDNNLVSELRLRSNNNEMSLHLNSGNPVDTRCNIKLISNGIVRHASFRMLSGTVAYLSDIPSQPITPVDQIFIFDGAVAPLGFVERKGQSIDKTTMPKLFARYGEKMPDDRNKVHRVYGELTGGAGDSQDDAIQKIEGVLSDVFFGPGRGSRGVFSLENRGVTPYGGQGGNILSSNILLKLEDSARTAQETRVKSRIVIACNKIQ